MSSVEFFALPAEGEQTVGMQLDALVATLRFRKVTDATQTGKLVAAFLRSALAAIASGRPDATVGDVLRDLRFVEAHVQAAVPTVFIAANVCARVVRVLVEEAEKKAAASASAAATTTATAAAAGGSAAGAAAPASTSAPSAVAAVREAARAALLASATAASGGAAATGGAAASPSSGSGDAASSVAYRSVREGVLDAVLELQDELDSATTTTSGAAAEYLCDDDVVLLAGGFDAVAASFVASARKRGVSAFVAEGGPGLGGHRTASALVGAGDKAKPVPVTVIPDADAAAVVHRVHKIVIGAHAVVVASGSGGSSLRYVCDAGVLGVALVAQAAGKPVLVVCNALKVVPSAGSGARADRVLATAEDAETAPTDVLPLAAMAALPTALEVSSPAFDVVPGDLVTACITNAQTVSSAAQVARLAQDLYGGA